MKDGVFWVVFVGVLSPFGIIALILSSLIVLVFQVINSRMIPFLWFSILGVAVFYCLLHLVQDRQYLNSFYANLWIALATLPLIVTACYFPALQMPSFVLAYAGTFLIWYFVPMANLRQF